MILVTMPPRYEAERRYAIEVLLGALIGVPYTIVPTPGACWQLAVAGSAAQLQLPDGWAGAAVTGHEPPLPTAPVTVPATRPDSVAPACPLLFAAPAPVADGIAFDPFAAAFWYASGQDERSSPVRDRHGRFPASASAVAAWGLLARPLLDEYANWLAQQLDRLWPGLVPPRVRGQVRITCDVDAPFSPETRRPLYLGRRLLADLVRRRSLAMFRERLRNRARVQRGDWRGDPLYRFDWMLELAARHDLRWHFFFIAGHTDARHDGCYDILEAPAVALLGDLLARGHAVGLHGSYGSSTSAPVLAAERARLQQACARAGFAAAPVQDARQHFLRWDAAQTPAALAAAGFAVDWTPGFADQPGFRCGTARRFPAWDAVRRCPLPLQVQPLVLMDGTLFAGHYLGLSPDRPALAQALALREQALAHGGDFTLLWHNSMLQTPALEAFLEALLN